MAQAQAKSNPNNYGLMSCDKTAISLTHISYLDNQQKRTNVLVFY